MGDLIEKNKIYEAVYDLACKSAGVIGGISEDYAYGLREAAHMIEEAPAVDAVPVSHGRWVEYPVAHYFKCSKCKYIVPYKKAVRINEKQAYNYCPSCGAKMDGEGDAE